MYQLIHYNFSTLQLDYTD